MPNVLITNKKNDLQVDCLSFNKGTDHINPYLEMAITDRENIVKVCKTFKHEVLFVLPNRNNNFEISFKLTSINII